MSLLNSPSDGLHSILIAIYETLRIHQDLTREELLKLTAPLPLFFGNKKPQEKAKATLNRWIQLGLFCENQNNQIAICENNLPLVVLARNRLFDASNNIDFLETKSAPAGDFTRAATWFLSQNAWTLDSNSWNKIQPLMMRQLPNLKLISSKSGVDHALLDDEGHEEEEDEEEGDESGQGEEMSKKLAGNLIQNGSRWKIFCNWARFLGFGWKAKSGLLVPDPTEAVRDALPQVFGDARELEARSVVNALAQAIPVLDGGTYRQKLEAELKKTQGPDAWRPPPNGQLSTSLSRALLRLQEEKYIKGEMRDDNEANVRVSLSGRNNQIIAVYSHFSLIG
jgi:hypothetical protein